MSPPTREPAPCRLLLSTAPSPPVWRVCPLSLRANVTRGYAHPKPLRSSQLQPNLRCGEGGHRRPPPLLPFVKATYGSEMGLLGQLRL